MKRTPLYRRTPLRRRNLKRLARLRAKTFGPQAARCRELPCCVCDRAPSEPHHVRSRGAGGTDADCVALCRACHDEVHRIGIDSFGERHGVDLRTEARVLAAFMEAGCG